MTLGASDSRLEEPQRREVSGSGPMLHPRSLSPPGTIQSHPTYFCDENTCCAHQLSCPLSPPMASSLQHEIGWPRRSATAEWKELVGYLDQIIWSLIAIRHAKTRPLCFCRFQICMLDENLYF